MFTRSGSTWTQQGEKLTGGGETGKGGFSTSVALSADGNTALIGAPYDDGGTGAAWVFTRSSGVWSQQGSKLTGTGEVGEGRFGYSVALSADGNTALIGARFDDSGKGAAWVFTRSGSTWTQQGEKLTGAGGTEEGEFGYSVALSADGNTALIGEPEDNNRTGAAWAFTRSGSTWTQQGEKLTGTGKIGAGEFGGSVALSADGNTALIGGRFDDSGKGAAWVFTRSGSTWTQQGEKLTGTGEIGEGRFGYERRALRRWQHGARSAVPEDDTAAGGVGLHAHGRGLEPAGAEAGRRRRGQQRVQGVLVALSADGNTALVGGWKDNRHNRRGVGVHPQRRGVDPAGPEAGRHGRDREWRSARQPVALSADGNTAIVGGPATTTAKARPGCSRARRRLDPAGRKARRHGRDREPPGSRLLGGAVRRRQHRTDRRLARRQLEGRGLGVHALGLDLDPAGRKAHRHG